MFAGARSIGLTLWKANVKQIWSPLWDSVESQPLSPWLVRLNYAVTDTCRPSLRRESSLHREIWDRVCGRRVLHCATNLLHYNMCVGLFIPKLRNGPVSNWLHSNNIEKCLRLSSRQGLWSIARNTYIRFFPEMFLQVNWILVHFTILS